MVWYSNISRKRLDRFAWNFQGRFGVTMGLPGYILVNSGKRVNSSLSPAIAQTTGVITSQYHSLGGSRGCCASHHNLFMITKEHLQAMSLISTNQTMPRSTQPGHPCRPWVTRRNDIAHWRWLRPPLGKTESSACVSIGLTLLGLLAYWVS